MLQFLSSVLPSLGNYVLHTQTKTESKKWAKNHHAETLQDLVALAQQLDSDPEVSVFYALGAFEDNIDGKKISRTQEKATRFKTLAFDVDPKDKAKNTLYADKRAMAQTTMAACKTIGIPDPVFVSSGNGLHCYYPLISDIKRDDWIALSKLLRDALLATGMQLDTSKICDASMGLRPVGCHNKKASDVLTVKLLSPMAVFDPLVLEAALKAFMPTAMQSATLKPLSKRTSAVLDAIMTTDYPPSDSALVETRCAQLKLVNTAGGNVIEPLWRLALGIAKNCIEPDATARRWSDQHPGFSEAEMRQKMAAWKGDATTCAKFEDLDKTPCAECKHRGVVKSPIQLGVSQVSDPIVMPATTTMRLPKGYVVKDMKIFRVDGEDASFVSDYLLFPNCRYKDDDTGKTVCHVDAHLPKEGWKTFDLSMDTLAKTSDFQQWLMNHQLFVSSDITLIAMRRYMLTYLQELQQHTESDQMSTSFGWMDDKFESFVLGDRLIYFDKTNSIRLSNLATGFTDALKSKGNKEDWVKATSMFGKPGMELHGLAFLMSMGSPLMSGSGLKSVLVNIYSKDSGTGKTTTGLFALSVYGNPDKLKLTVQDTDNSIFKTMGIYGNLPVYIDEITEVERARLGKIVYFTTQGREKVRMTKEGGFQESVDWESLSLSSSNKDLIELLGDQVASEGEAMRILQLNIRQNEIFNSDDGSNFGYEMSLFLQRNYGLVGDDFIRAMIEMGGPQKIYAQARASLATKYKFVFQGKERFWQSAIIIAYATGRIAHKLGLISFDYSPCIYAGLAHISKLRLEMNAGRLDCFDTLGLYLNDHASKIVVFKKNTSQKSEGSVIAPYPHEAVARVEILCTNTCSYTSGRVQINQVHFNNWCKEKGVDRRHVFTSLTAEGVSNNGEHRVSLMKGTDKPLPAVRVFEVELKHPRFVNIMTQTQIVPTHGLHVVQGGINANIA